MFDVDYCGGGSLADALRQAEYDVRRMGEQAVVSIAVMPDSSVPDCWWVNITYQPQRANSDSAFYRRQ